MNKYAAHSRISQLARRRYRGCERKKAYNSRTEAIQPGQYVYHCRFCKKWHRTGQAATLTAQLRRK